MIGRSSRGVLSVRVQKFLSPLHAAFSVCLCSSAVALAFTQKFA